jgi:hypothetical protein
MPCHSKADSPSDISHQWIGIARRLLNSEKKKALKKHLRDEKRKEDTANALTKLKVEDTNEDIMRDIMNMEEADQSTRDMLTLILKKGDSSATGSAVGTARSRVSSSGQRRVLSGSAKQAMMRAESDMMGSITNMPFQSGSVSGLDLKGQQESLPLEPEGVIEATPAETPLKVGSRSSSTNTISLLTKEDPSQRPSKDPGEVAVPVSVDLTEEVQPKPKPKKTSSRHASAHKKKK